MAASEVQGLEPHFLGFRDFGFSKSAEETFRAWGQTELLRRMVLHIRRLRPDVIITNHDTTSGHGHHQATGRMIIEAFFDAADPNKFPEQLTQVSIWQTQRLFVRNRGQEPQTATGKEGPPQVITIDPNEMDPVRHDVRATSTIRFTETRVARPVAQNSSREWCAPYSLQAS